MATVDTLLVRIEADMRGLRRDLASVQRQTADNTQRMKKSFAGVTSGINAAKRAAVGFLAAFSVGKIVGTIRTFEDLQATLKAVAGDAGLAEASFQLITKFTATTTFQLDQVTGAFITLVNAGIAPTEDALKDIGNLAAARGKDIRDVAQAIFNATTGEMEMLKQLGIIARVEGDSLAVTYKGTTETIERSADSIVGYIRELSQQEFPTAIEERANTLSGAISNLQDQISLFFMAVGDAGLKQALTDFTKFLIDGSSGAGKLARVLGRVLGGAVRGLHAGLKLVADNMEAFVVAIGSFIAMKAALTFLALGSAVLKAATAAGLLARAMQIVNAVMKRNPALFIAIALGTLAMQFDAVKEKLNEFLRVMGMSDEQAEETSKSIEDLNRQIKDGFTNTKPAAQALGEYNDTIDKLREKAKIARLEAAGMSQAMIQAIRDAGQLQNVTIAPSGLPFIQTRSLRDEQEGKGKGRLSADQLMLLQDEVEAARQATEALEEHRRAMDSARDAVDGLRTEEDNLRQTLVDLKTALDNGTISQKEFEEATKATKQAIFEQSEVGQVVMSTIGKVSQTVSQGIADVITNSGEGLKSFKEMFRGIVNSIIQQLIEMKIQALITSQALSFIGGGSGGGGGFFSSIISGIGSIFGGGSGGGGTVPLGSPGTTAVSTVTTAATGSSAPAGQSFLVGERGPEIFTPRASGMITPNNMLNMAMSGGQRLNGGGGGPNITQNFNVTTGVVQTVRAEILNMMPLIKQESVNAVIDARQRGGSTAAGLGA